MHLCEICSAHSAAPLVLSSSRVPYSVLQYLFSVPGPQALNGSKENRPTARGSPRKPFGSGNLQGGPQKNLPKVFLKTFVFRAP